MKNVWWRISWRCPGPLMLGVGRTYAWLGLPFAVVGYGYYHWQVWRQWCTPGRWFGVRVYRMPVLGLYVNVNASRSPERIVAEVSIAVGVGIALISISVVDFDVIVPAWREYFQKQEGGA